MAINLRVTPEELRTKAGQISSEIDQIERQWNKVQEIVSASGGYWQGEASQAHQRLVRSFSAEAASILRRLKEQPISLQQMAGVYVETESGAKNLSSSLPENVIS